VTDPRVQTVVQLSENRIKKLDEIADRLSVTRSVVIRFAIDAYVASFFVPTLATDSQSSTAETTEAAA
jgi:predicted transcriptional regulator